MCESVISTCVCKGKVRLHEIGTCVECDSSWIRK
jgi:hypothetical protein